MRLSSKEGLQIWTAAAAAAAAKSLQSCPTLCDPVESSLPCSSVLGILQAKMLEWVAISFSNAWKWKVKVKYLSQVWLFVTPWTAAHEAPPSMGFSRQEYWSGVSSPSPSNNLEWDHFLSKVWSRLVVPVEEKILYCNFLSLFSFSFHVLNLSEVTCFIFILFICSKDSFVENLYL